MPRCAWLVFTVVLSGCAFLRPAREPMERVAFRERGPGVARGAIVLLPGFGDRPSAFEEHGFVATLTQLAPDYDIFAADAHFGYYRKRIVIERLEHDVIGPLAARGYRELWIAGTSMGGFGAVAYARMHPQGVRGLLLFAPYMGPRQVVDEVTKVGLCRFAPSSADEGGEANFARANFMWLKQQACVEARERKDEVRGSAREPKDQHAVGLWLGVGQDDGLALHNRLLGDALPSSHMLVLSGGHGWSVWTPALARLAPLAFDSPSAPH